MGKRIRRRVRRESKISEAEIRLCFPLGLKVGLHSGLKRACGCARVCYVCRERVRTCLDLSVGEPLKISVVSSLVPALFLSCQLPGANNVNENQVASRSIALQSRNVGGIKTPLYGAEMSLASSKIHFWLPCSLASRRVWNSSLPTS